MADTRGRPTLPPYPENPETRKGKRLSPEKVQSLKARYGIDIDPPSASSGPAAPEDTYPNDGWVRKHETLNIHSGWFAFPAPIVENRSFAGAILHSYPAYGTVLPKDRCWFDFFEGDRCCLRIGIFRNRTAITYNQVVNNAWTAEVYYELPDALAEGRDLGLRVFLEDGQFCVSWDTEGADLDWGAAADSMEYRAVPDSAALFGESVTGSFVMKFP
ncbi:hypothetical protein BDV32DRAFT_125573 [Aspergillus pseudonomiae]|uniref:Uncharacterized protein n=1 Tax=Aspergillus pseudonomiae TaxID=1506151 RepID=A0A5N6HVZ7_9EURO|nr:uncharacterized protein BDV37DRAFT_284614 [Aspergillus pseudonomiae]KAB8258641.1 hypothetical protein BDV32DRAFT_125573 [Aspergillus pseudonomiae]KAE8402478.1 hypothetical protein BDV37DRAFT_284614 [Aspergillus pseudonomiae]